jgi:L-threonylcarbamoyladenylate synthase
MKILDINKNYKEAIKQTALVIKNGGLVVFPSDTVYILAVDPTNSNAVEKLLTFKNRWTGKAISIAVADQKMAEDYVELLDTTKSIYKNLLPGPFTIVSNGKHKTVRGIESETGTLGIRIPDSKYIFDLIRAVGKPVTATSANLSGRTPNYSIKSFLRPLSKKKQEMIDLIVDAGKLPKNKPSTVIDATKPELEILRRGDLITGSTQTLISRSEKETEKVAEFLLKKALNNNNGKPILFSLSGDLGCGKTVFSRKVGQSLGVKEKITSPTFVIYNEYPIQDNGKINKFLHFDLYRVTAAYELEEIKFFDLFTDKSLACIEWPENMGQKNFDKLKEMTYVIPVNFEYVDPTTREIRYEI